MPHLPPPARVASIPYLNTAPFYLHWADLENASKGHWIPTILPPRQIGLAAEAGKVDAGLMPLADLIRLAGDFEPLVVPSAGSPVTFGIANRDKVDSVLLFLRGEAGRINARTMAAEREGNRSSNAPPGRGRAAEEITGRGRVLSPLEARALEGASIAITGESSTSFRLLRLLLEVRHRVRPREYLRMDLGTTVDPAPGSQPCSAALVIGNLALRWKYRPPAGFYLAMDLASAWYDWTGLPFVFARWVVRRSLPEERKVWLGRFLEDSLSAAAGHYAELVRNLPKDLGPEAELVEYLENFIYRLGPDELLAAALFESRLAEHGIVCSGA